jgi:hypothetical protein
MRTKSQRQSHYRDQAAVIVRPAPPLPPCDASAAPGCRRLSSLRLTLAGAI